MHRILAAVAALAIVAILAVPAFADQGGQPDEAASFGQCVSWHAQMGDLDGAMNPGMHQGNSGDHDMAECP